MVAHEILVSAQGPLVLGFGVWGLRDWGLGLTKGGLRGLLHHYQNASIQGRQIQCRKDQMQVSHVNKNMVEQSSTVPFSQSIRST